MLGIKLGIYHSIFNFKDYVFCCCSVETEFMTIEFLFFNLNSSFVDLDFYFYELSGTTLGFIILGAFFLDIWGAETSMKKGFMALGWTALFLIGLFFADRDKEN